MLGISKWRGQDSLSDGFDVLSENLLVVTLGVSWWQHWESLGGGAGSLTDGSGALGGGAGSLPDDVVLCQVQCWDSVICGARDL